VWGSTFAPSSSLNSFPISFAVPLSEPPEPIYVNANEESKPGCPGRGGAPFAEEDEPTTPEAEEGKLCVYEMSAFGVTSKQFLTYEFSAGEFFTAIGAGRSGTLLNVNCEGACAANGTWAVTAE
jgi:hypothetical protein